MHELKARNHGTRCKAEHGAEALQRAEAAPAAVASAATAGGRGWMLTL